MTEQNGRDLQREKGEATRKKKWEMRQEKKRLLALKQQQEAEKKRRRWEMFPLDVLSSSGERLLQGDITGAMRTRASCPMRKLFP